MSGARFNDVVGRITYPMFVVTAADGDERSGCLVGFATQSSIRPPRFLVFLSKVNHTYGVARRAGVLAVHVLSAGDRDLAELFGSETGDDVDKFARCRWHAGPEGVPVIDGLDWFCGRVVGRFDGGDHEGFLLDPTAAGLREDDARPLDYQAVKDMTPGHPA